MFTHVNVCTHISVVAQEPQTCYRLVLDPMKPLPIVAAAFSCTGGHGPCRNSTELTQTGISSYYHVLTSACSICLIAVLVMDRLIHRSW